MFKLYFCRLSKQSHIVISIFTKQPSTIKKNGSTENKLVCLCEKVAVSYNKRIPLFTLLLLKLLCCNYFSSWLEGSEAGGGGHMFTGIITGPRKPFQYLNITTDLKKKKCYSKTIGELLHIIRCF